VDKDSLALLLARGFSLEEIGQRFDRHPSTVSYWVKKHGLRAVNRDRHASRGGIERERLQSLVNEGGSIAEIAGELGLSKATVRYWLRRYGLRTLNGRGPHMSALAEAAKEAGLSSVLMSCPHHGEAEFSIEGRGYYRCKRCRSEAVTRRRRRVKAILVAESGGRCSVCGYRRCLGALSFHHLDPSEKLLHVSAYGNGLSLDTLRAEAGKCVLLCANCHAEVENGMTAVSLQSPPP
jgi:transposase-like protein